MIIIELDDGKIYRKALYLMEQKPWFPVDFLLNQPNEIVITGIKLPASSRPSLWTKNAKSLTHWCAEEPKYEMQRMTWGFAFQIYQLYKVSYIHMFVKVFYPEVWKMNWLVVSNMNFMFHLYMGYYGMSSETHWRTPSFFKMGTLHHQMISHEFWHRSIQGCPCPYIARIQGSPWSSPSRTLAP